MCVTPTGSMCRCAGCLLPAGCAHPSRVLPARMRTSCTICQQNAHFRPAGYAERAHPNSQDGDSVHALPARICRMCMPSMRGHCWCLLHKLPILLPARCRAGRAYKCTPRLHAALRVAAAPAVVAAADRQRPEQHVGSLVSGAASQQPAHSRIKPVIQRVWGGTGQGCCTGSCVSE